MRTMRERATRVMKIKCFADTRSVALRNLKECVTKDTHNEYGFVDQLVLY